MVEILKAPAEKTISIKSIYQTDLINIEILKYWHENCRFKNSEKTFPNSPEKKVTNLLQITTNNQKRKIA